MHRLRPPPWLLVLLGYTVLSVIFFLPTWASPTTRYAGGGGDPLQSMWFLAWTPHALLHGENPLFSTAINHPTGVNLMWNTAAPLLGILLAPLTMTLGPVFAYNVLVTAELAAAAFLAYLCGRRLLTSRWAAIAAGLVYGFCPYLVAQEAGHGKVAFQLLPPLMLLLFDSLLVRRTVSTRRGGLLIGLALACQALVFEEGLALAVIAGGLGLVAAAIIWRAQMREPLIRLLHAIPWAVLALVVVAGVPLLYQFFGPQALHQSIPGSSTYVIDPANLVIPTRGQLIAPASAVAFSTTLPGNAAERDGYLGIGLLLSILLIAISRWRDRRIRWLLLSSVLVLILCMGPTLIIGDDNTRIWLPWHLIDHIPVIRNAYPSRLFIYVDLGAALMLAAVVEMAFDTAAGRTRRTLAVACGVVAFAGLIPAGGALSTAVATPSFFSTGAGAIAGDVVLPIPYVNSGANDWPMLWQANSGMAFSMPGGYFINITNASHNGDSNTATGELFDNVVRGIELRPGVPTLAAVRAEISAWRVTQIVVGPMPHESAAAAIVTELVGHGPVSAGGVLRWSVPSTLTGS